jgi:hypothetical protein
VQIWILPERLRKKFTYSLFQTCGRKAFTDQFTWRPFGGKSRFVRGGRRCEETGFLWLSLSWGFLWVFSLFFLFLGGKGGVQASFDSPGEGGGGEGIQGGFQDWGEFGGGHALASPTASQTVLVRVEMTNHVPHVSPHCAVSP